SVNIRIVPCLSVPRRGRPQTVWRVYTEIKFSTLPSVRLRAVFLSNFKHLSDIVVRRRSTRLGIVDWVLPSRKLPARFGCKLASLREGKFLTAEHHMVDGSSPTERKNPCALAGRVDD